MIKFYICKYYNLKKRDWEKFRKMDKYLLYAYGLWLILVTISVVLMFMKKKQMATYFFMAQLMLFMLILTVNILKLMS